MLLINQYMYAYITSLGSGLGGEVLMAHLIPPQPKIPDMSLVQLIVQHIIHIHKHRYTHTVMLIHVHVCQ